MYPTSSNSNSNSHIGDDAALDVPDNGVVGRGSVVVGRALGELDPAGELGSDESDSSEDLEALDAAASEYSKEVESELLRTVPRRSGETEYELLLRAGFFHDSLDGISPGWFDSAALGYADTWKGGRVFVFPSRAFRTGVAWRRLVREADRRAGGPTLELRLRARQAARALGRARAERAAPLRAPPVGQLRDEEARRLEAAVVRCCHQLILTCVMEGCNCK